MEHTERVKIRVYHPKDGYREHVVDVTVDYNELARHLGGRAVKNKTGRSHLAAGVKVVEVR